MFKKNVLIDASSAIILCRSGLHSLLVETYLIVLTESVYGEITDTPHVGSDEYKRLFAGKEIQVLANPDKQERQEMAGLDQGERATVQLYYKGAGDFILTDDGQAARYCRKEKIPFINALLFPVVLRFAGIIDEEFCRRSMDAVIDSARYSQEIIDVAEHCQKKTIAFALPYQ